MAQKKASGKSAGSAKAQATGTMPCWEFKKCGREAGGAKAEQMGVCPAYPNNGRDCWMAAGTFCGGTVQGTYAEKLGNCQQCEYYMKVMSGVL
jgi:hypothetical protein